MLKAIIFLVVLAATSSFTSTAHSQTERKTVTLPSGEVVCELNGEWNALYEHYGPLEWVGNIKGMLMIVQEGGTFVGKTTMDSAWSAKGAEKIRGELDKDGIKNAKYSIPGSGWADAKGEIGKNCDKVVIDTGSGVRAILERK